MERDYIAGGGSLVLWNTPSDNRLHALGLDNSG